MPSEVLEHPVVLDEHPLSLRDVELHAVPVGLGDRLPSSRFENEGGIEIDDQGAACAPGGAEDRHHSVDVLRRGPDEVEAPSPFEGLGELPFEIGLGGESLARPRSPDRRSFHQEDIDIRGRILDHRLDQRRLAAVGAKVAGVVDALAIRLHEQGVGVEGAVIDEVGRDAEGPDLHRPAVMEETGIGESVALRNEGARRLQDVVRRLADMDRDLRADVPGQTVVVGMGVRDHHAQQAVVRLPEAGDPREQAFIHIPIGVNRRVEGHTDIEDDPLPLRLDLDAGAADLPGASMDSDSHAS